jgi:Ca2+-binding EF-hand superfamily protein
MTSPSQSFAFWNVKVPQQDTLVTDLWRHRQINSGRASTPASSEQQGQYASSIWAAASRLNGQTSAINVSDLQTALRTTSTSSPSFNVGAQGSLSSLSTVAELSDRRREAIKSAFRQIDVHCNGSVNGQDLRNALMKYSNLHARDQEALVNGLLQHGSAGQVPYAHFTWYYQVLGGRLERDRDFEDLLRHHWGFAEVSDILEDMKNKLAMLGMAYAFRGASTLPVEMTTASLQAAMSALGMHYSITDVQRVVDAFSVPELHGSSSSSTIGIMELSQHMTNAPRPTTPLPRAVGTAHFSELGSSAPSRTGHSAPMSPAASFHGASLQNISTSGSWGLHTVPEHVTHGLSADLPHPEVCPAEMPPTILSTEAVSPGGALHHDVHPLHAPPEQLHHRHSSHYPVSAQGNRPPGRVASLLAKGNGRKRAVTIGINYIGHQVGQLPGCINDSNSFVHMLTEEFGYGLEHIRQLRDDHPDQMPTRKNITAALKWLVAGARAGDHLFLHYSGHGAQIRSQDADEMDGKDETLVPVDYKVSGLLVDDELRRLVVVPMPKGARLTCVFDCCHSGTVLDLGYKVKLVGDKAEIKKKQKPPPPADGDVVMISGCMDAQTSADIGSSAASKAAGAMTTAFRNTITNHPEISNHRLLVEIRKFLRNNDYEQIPQLSTEHFMNVEEPFLPEAKGLRH